MAVVWGGGRVMKMVILTDTLWTATQDPFMYCSDVCVMSGFYRFFFIILSVNDPLGLLYLKGV